MLASSGKWPPEIDWFEILGGKPEISRWRRFAGDPDETTKFPGDMVVHCVRVYKRLTAAE
jgi:hypothetical protein